MSALALERIAECKRNRSLWLDLGNCGLEGYIPEEVFELEWLEAINLGSGKFTANGDFESWQRNFGPANRLGWSDFEQLSKLPNLRKFCADECGLHTIGDVAKLKNLELISFEGNQITQISGLETLVGLKTLWLSRNQISQISDLENLINLQDLSLDGNQISQINGLENLINLQDLSLDDNQISQISGLENLVGLQHLSLGGNQISQINGLENLINLQDLSLDDNQISQISGLEYLVGLRKLWLSRNQISQISGLEILVGLQHLSLRGNQISQINGLENLINLQDLSLDDNQITQISGLENLIGLQTAWLHNNQISQISGLETLVALKDLRLDSNQISQISGLETFVGLRELWLNGNRISQLSGLGNLVGLEILRLDNNHISQVRGLEALVRLEILWIDMNQISQISGLETLIGLRALGVSSNPIKDLTPLIFLIKKGVPVTLDTGGSGILLKDCPLTTPPLEVVQQGNEAILNYFQERENQGTDTLYEAKLLLLGAGGSGKTSLCRRLYQPEKNLPQEQETTKGIDIQRHDFPLPNGRNFRLNVWDFGGQEIYHATHQFFLTKRSLYVLLDDTREDHKTVQDEGFKYWLEGIDLLSEHSPVLIFQNMKGGRSKDVDLPGIKGRFDNVKELYRGDLLADPAAAEPIGAAIRLFASQLPHIGEQLPKKWIAIRADLEIRAAEAPYIAQEEYFDIYRRHLEFDRTKALHLSRYLHDLGVFLHFQDDPALRKTIILQNTWATAAVFALLDDEGVKARQGRFTAADCDRIWAADCYADMHNELLALMTKFELCYPLHDSRPALWLAPQLLPSSKPEELGDWEQPGDLLLRYRYTTFKPKGLLNRLMVRMQRYVCDPTCSWKSGVMFEHEGNQLLAEEAYSSPEILLRAHGPEPKALLTLIAADLDALNDGFGALRDRVEKKIPCICSQCKLAAQPFFYDYASLKNRRDKGRRLVECDRSFEEVEVVALLDGIFDDSLKSLNKRELEALLVDGELKKVLEYFRPHRPDAVILLGELAEATQQYGDGRIGYKGEYETVFNRILVAVRGWI